jgi:hypothetical protein
LVQTVRTIELLQSKATVTMTTVATFRYAASPIEKRKQKPQPATARTSQKNTNRHHDRCTIATELVNLFVEKNKIS